MSISPTPLATATMPAAAPPEPVMELTVHRDALLAELSLLRGISTTQTTIPILTNLLLEARGGRLFLSATNLGESLCTSVPAQIRQEGAATVPARKFFDYLRLLPAADLSLKLLPNAWLQIHCGRSRTKMLGMDRANFPQLPSAGDLPHISMSAELLRMAIPRVSPAVPADDSRHTISGALMALAPQLFTMVATDGHRLAKVEHSVALPGVEAERAILVPACTLTTLLALLADRKDEVVEFAEDGAHLYFQLGNRQLTSRKMSGVFPNYKGVLPAANGNTMIVPLVEFEKSVRRVAQFADDRSLAVKLALSANTLRISSRSSEKGESEDVIETPYTRDAIAIGFNATYLLDFCKAIAGEVELSLELKDAASAAVFRPESPSAEYAYLYVLMPMRA